MSYQSLVMIGVATTARPHSRTCSGSGARHEVCACTCRSAQAAVRGVGDAG